MFFLQLFIRFKNPCIKREEERVQKANWRQQKREMDPDYFEKVKEYDRPRKRKVRDLMSWASETLLRSETAS